jgi:hypothetical protein
MLLLAERFEHDWVVDSYLASAGRLHALGQLHEVARRGAADRGRSKGLSGRSGRRRKSASRLPWA